MKQIPNLFTLLNLLFGCMAIVVILQNGIVLHYDDEGAALVTVSENVRLGAFFIGCAALIDFMDGFVARMLRASSELGKQLDSLADVVSFGVAPAMILYQFLRMGYVAREDGINISMIWLIPAFIFAMAAAYRLGKFNLITEPTEGFRGVPTPAAGLLIASLPFIYWESTSPFIHDLLLNVWVMYAIIIVVSLLMISNLPMLNLKFKNFRIAENFPRYLLLLVAVLAIVVLGWLSVPVIFLAYILLSLLFKPKA